MDDEEVIPLLFKKKPEAREENAVKYIRVGAIYPNPAQPRTFFDQESLNELSSSIRTHGILQPLSVRQMGENYELVAGERRLRAAKMAGLGEVPCIVLHISDVQSSLLALIENLQRRDLDFFETAQGYQRLIDIYGLTQAEAAERLGKSQSSVANKLRLLRYPPEAVAFIREHGLTERHARAVLRLPDEAQKMEALRRIAAEEMTVFSAEQLVEAMLNPPPPEPEPAAIAVTPPEEEEHESRASAERMKKARLFPLIRDVRVFINSVTRAVEVMKNTGIPARYDKDEDEETIVLTVRIPKAKKVGT